MLRITSDEFTIILSAFQKTCPSQNRHQNHKKVQKKKEILYPGQVPDFQAGYVLHVEGKSIDA